MAFSLAPVPASRGGLIVLYDGTCGFCRVMLALLLRCDRMRRLDPAAIQSPRGEQLLADVAREERLESWHVIDARGVRRSAGAGIPVVLAALPGERRSRSSPRDLRGPPHARTCGWQSTGAASADCSTRERARGQSA